MIRVSKLFYNAINIIPLFIHSHLRNSKKTKAAQFVSFSLLGFYFVQFACIVISPYLVTYIVARAKQIVSSFKLTDK